MFFPSIWVIPLLESVITATLGIALSSCQEAQPDAQSVSENIFSANTMHFTAQLKYIISFDYRKVNIYRVQTGLRRTSLRGMHPLEFRDCKAEGMAFAAYILWSSGFVRMELLSLTDAQRGP
jgi:hypothetical protein